MPGHGARFEEMPFENVTDMATEAAAVIEDDASGVPFAFYGHSLGAVVAYETAKLLQARADGAGQSSPFHLFVGAARAPQLPRVLAPISQLPQDEFLNAVQSRYGGLPAALFEEPELLEIFLPVLRADFSAYESYQYVEPAPLRRPVTAFHGVHDPVVRSAAVNEWARVTEAGFQFEHLEGDHFFLSANTCREALLKRISGCFEKEVPRSQAGLSAHLSTST
jgi:medium-chain acyl-[acyl-carrier-protein] hydrolase